MTDNSISWVEIGHTNDIDDDSSKNASHPDANLFMVKKDGLVYVYVNSCPHLSIPLEMNQDEFLDSEHHFIQCSTHGALFNAHDGLCVSGPCSGESLMAVTSKIEDGKILVQLP
ncbi:MAG: Rieske 2Fe-2S domain-containing protein [Pseudomonadota bacterium]